MSRWEALKRNTKWGDRIRLGLLALLFAVLMIAALFHPMARAIALVVLLGFWAPWLVRDLLAEHCGPVSKVLRAAAIVLIGLSFAGSAVMKAVPKDLEMTFALILFGILGLYTGTYFWLLSDARVTRR
ncbi:MAG: hypothetical protein RDV48_12490 [Candidatus Eremiobacteraeota bacterium]|nr:hypothetical protein [Candidatus Eremiobacteraeota bacterium]